LLTNQPATKNGTTTLLDLSFEYNRLADSSAIPLDGLPNLSYDNATNRITTTGFEYDAAGNQTRALADNGTDWLLYEYDAANRIQVIKEDGSTPTTIQAFQYGSTNARLMDLDYGYGYLKLFASVGGTTLAEYTEYIGAVPTWSKSYTHLGSSQLATVTPDGLGGEYVEFNHPDTLGTKLKTNQAGGTSVEQNTLPFGTALNAESSLTANNKRFTSYDRSDATGLDYAVNRTYDSKQGRFTQVDPIGLSAVSLAVPQTLNMYTYCGNDPINHVDPNGLFFGSLFKWVWKIFKVIVATVLAVISVLAFSMGHVWAGLALATTAASIFAETFGLKSLQKLIAIVSIAISIARIRLMGITTVPIFPFAGQGSGGIDQRVISFLGNVGAIASSFAQRKDKKPKKKAKSEVQTIADNALFGAIKRLNGLCRTYILGPEDNFTDEQLKKIVVQYVPSLGGATAQTVAGSGLKGVIKVSGKFFRTGIKNNNGGWSYSIDDKFVREAFILHELRHSLGGVIHPRDARGNEIATGPDSNYGFMDAISRYCF